MVTMTQEMPPVARGYVYPFRMSVPDGEAPFPEGVRLRAEVRDFAGADHVLGVLTTENGGLARVDDRTVDVVVAASITGLLTNTVMAIDFARVDVVPVRFLAIGVSLTVIEPVTRPQVAA